MKQHLYLCIDLKSFYASVECVERRMDAMTTNLVVADPKRGNGTICLAVSPSMKALGVRNRCRVFEIPKNINYITAPPQMQKYIDYSAGIYGIYLKYIAKEDIHVYSIDEAFLDVTDYLDFYHVSAKELAVMIMDDIKDSFGITASCGIGTNLYLCKIALDITAKHVKDNIGFLNEKIYRETLWNHRPITDFWRVGPGTAQRLANMGIETMGDITSADERSLYKIFGVDAELLIDHAWGREPTTISDIKAYKPKENSLSSGQVLMEDYKYEDGLLIVKEMVDSLCLELVDRCLVTDTIGLHVGYSKKYAMKSVQCSSKIPVITSSVRILMKYFVKLYQQHVNPCIPVRRITIAFQNVRNDIYEQYSFFMNPALEEKDQQIQKTVLQIQKKYGKDALFKGMNLQEKSTAFIRNHQIGGHNSGL